MNQQKNKCECHQTIIPDLYVDDQIAICQTKHFYYPITNQASDEWTDYIKYVTSFVKNDGLWAEFGVHSGTSINKISNICKPKWIYGFDSFRGLPEDWEDLPKGFFDMGGQLPKINSNVRIMVGLFENTIPPFIATMMKKDDNVAFLHIDCDLYSSTKTILENFYPYIGADTVIAFDEVHRTRKALNGEMKAFKEFSFKYEWIAHCIGMPAALIIL